MEWRTCQRCGREYPDTRKMPICGFCNCEDKGLKLKVVEEDGTVYRFSKIKPS